MYLDGVDYMKNKIILTELKRLSDNNIITDETLEKVRKYYENEKKGKSFSTYLTIIGLIMISLGVILLFAYNWSHLTRITKAILILFVLIFSQGLFGYTLVKNKNWMSGAAVFVFAMSGLSIATISQMYNISGSDTNYYMVWLLLNIPNLYLSKSKLVGIPYAVINCLYLVSGGNILVYFLLMIPSLIFKRKDERYNKLGEVAIKVAFILGLFYWYEGLSSSGIYYLPFYSGIFALIYLWPTGLNRGAEFFILLIAYLQTLDSGYLLPKAMEYTTKPLLSWGIYTLALLSIVYLKKWKDPINYFVFLIIPIFFLGVGELVCNIYLLSLGLYFIWNGLQKNTVKIFNKGSILVCIILISRFLDYNISTLLRGIVFIAIGIIFILGNTWMSRRKL